MNMHFVFGSEDKKTAELALSIVDGREEHFSKATLKDRKGVLYAFVRDFSYRCDKVVPAITGKDSNAFFRASVVDSNGKLYPFRDPCSDKKFVRNSYRLKTVNDIPSEKDIYEMVNTLDKDGTGVVTITRDLMKALGKEI